MDPEFPELTDRLAECLGRLDDELLRLCRAPDSESAETLEALDLETAELQLLVDTLRELRTPPDRDADLNATVERCLRRVVLEAPRPIAVRKNLVAGLPAVACGHEELQHAIRRALLLAQGQIDGGGELAVETRQEASGPVLTISFTGAAAHLTDRMLTLRAFVAGLGGRCQLAGEPHGTTLTMALPAASREPDPS